MKKCSKCGNLKNLSDFYKQKNGKLGVRSTCKKCFSLLSHNYYIKNFIKILERNKKWQRKARKNFPCKQCFYDIKQRCDNPKNHAYKNYGGRGIKCLITEEELKKLWFRDKAYLLEKPSIDRKDNDGNYTYDNCQYMELVENSRKKKLDNCAKANK